MDRDVSICMSFSVWVILELTFILSCIPTRALYIGLINKGRSKWSPRSQNLLIIVGSTQNLIGKKHNTQNRIYQEYIKTSRCVVNFHLNLPLPTTRIFATPKLSRVLNMFINKAVNFLLISYKLKYKKNIKLLKLQFFSHST